MISSGIIIIMESILLAKNYLIVFLKKFFMRTIML